MDTWANVALLLGSNIIIALTTVAATKIQVSHSDKQADREHGRAIALSNSERRREVRSEPLLKLRAEMALMASKLDRLVKTSYQWSGNNETKSEFEKAKNDWQDYISKDDLSKTLFMLDDLEIVRSVQQAKDKYLESYEELTYHRTELDAKEIGYFARAPELEIRAEIVNIQSLINKRLEAL